MSAGLRVRNVDARPTASVAGIYESAAAPDLRDEPSAPGGQQPLAARLRCAERVAVLTGRTDADHRAGCPDRLGAEPALAPRPASSEPRARGLPASDGRSASHRDNAHRSGLGRG